MKTKNYLLHAVLTLGTVPMFAQEKPNIIIIMADDMGFSDIGCYGGEILTPNIDRLADHSLKFSQFYNTSRSCPTRASLMTGLFQHQAGIGWMSEDPKNRPVDTHDYGIEGYRGFLNKNCVTIGEVLKGAGYHTYAVGKWHLGMHGTEKWPLQRGFDRFYGILAGACSYLRPDGGRGLWEDNTKLPAPEAPYYTTDAFADHAIEYMNSTNDEDPFFLYLAFNAPHWPLQAKDEDIVKFYDKYRTEGWDTVRKNRLQKMIRLGLLDEDMEFAEWENRSWNQLTEAEKDMTAYRMAVYAAQVHCMDRNIGKVLDNLEKTGKMDNTVIFFLSDNGACAEPHNELGGGKQKDINNPAISGHPSYGKAWAQTSNTPFRKYKQRAYEGGISTPLLIHWKNNSIPSGEAYCDVRGYLPDIMATIVDLTGAEYPENYNGNEIIPLQGESLVPVMEGSRKQLHKYMYWEHQGNRAVRQGDWKAVWDQETNEWELYNIAEDRAERHDRAAEKPALTKKLAKKWNKWADETHVLKDFKNRKYEYVK